MRRQAYRLSRTHGVRKNQGAVHPVGSPGFDLEAAIWCSSLIGDADPEGDGRSLYLALALGTLETLGAICWRFEIS